jgi:phosphoribosylformimino-5-aminoimidazole carboxamide ribotide isomerase
MHILPVLDLKAGQIVRAVAGERARYRPVVSQIARSSEPSDVAEGYRFHLGLSELYLADLDAIGSGRPNFQTYMQLREHGFRLWVDAGIKSVRDVAALHETGVERVIAASETLKSFAVLEAACRRLGPDRIVFSLDLLTSRRRSEGGLMTMAAKAVAAGVRCVIVLDLAKVGMGQGTGTESLCRGLAAEYPHVAIYAGGGIRGREDLQGLRRDGVRGALIASAFHDGHLRRGDLASA